MGNYESYGEIAGMEEFMEGFAEGMSSVSLFGDLWSNLLTICTYVFMAIGMYTIAKRRGINHPWLAWIPFGNTWLLGCISDQYRYVAHGQEKSKRKLMLGFEIATAATGTITIVALIIGIIQMFGGMDMDMMEVVEPDAAYIAEALAPIVVALVLCFVMLGFAIALTVLQYMALHDLFKSCNPATSTVFLVLSIVLSLFGFGVVQAIFVFVTRNKDLGMPQRQTPVMYTQPTWQPTQPPVEPWEQNNEF